MFLFLLNKKILTKALCFKRVVKENFNLFPCCVFSAVSDDVKFTDVSNDVSTDVSSTNVTDVEEETSDDVTTWDDDDEDCVPSSSSNHVTEGPGRKQPKLVPTKTCLVRYSV